ncbi:MAG: hypothetical protein KF893_26275, partial [Caldilineaceae bacterium]|nr:hypothetical protein [Caldilineaceae bacterium]
MRVQPPTPTDSAHAGVDSLPQAIASVTDLEDLLSRPTRPALEALKSLDSDLVILGVSGKMGPTLARMAARAIQELNLPYQVYGVARFSQPAVQDQLEAAGVSTIAADLLD